MHPSRGTASSFEPTVSRRDAFPEAIAKAILDASDEQYTQEDHPLVLHSHRHGFTTASLRSQAFACMIAMIGRTRKPMTTTKCVCGVMLIEKEGVLTQVLGQEA
jgi:hypothetical protein